jgi:hypothetical protein
MKPRISDKIRVLISNKYLDWAEHLPKFNGSFVMNLQDIREDQRSRAEKEFRRSRPPEGTKIEYLYFRLIEIFHIEEFDKLLEGLIRLFPGLQDNSRNRDFLTDFRKLAGTIAGGGMYRLGLIYRDLKGKFFFSGSHCEIKDLPPEVTYVAVALHKVLPSIMFVTLDVHLTEEATERLLALQERYFLPKTRFFNLTPWKAARGYSQESIEIVRANEIFAWIDNLRGRVEKCIRSFCDGYFMQQISEKPRLPAIEVYGLKGLPEGEEAFQKWSNEARDWSESLGFHFHYDTYSDGKTLFTWSHTDSVHRYKGYRLTVLWKPYVESLKSSPSEGEERDAIMHYTEYTLDAILPCIGVIEFLISARRNVERLRQVVFGSMRIRSLPRYTLNKHIKLNNIIKRESMLLDRIAMEFEQRTNYIRYEMEPVQDMKETKTIPDGKQGGNLRDIMIESVKFDIGLLKKHLSLITTSFSEYLAARNMQVTYRLQRSIWGLTIVVTIATIAGLAANWPNIQNLLNGLMKIMKSILR